MLHYATQCYKEIKSILEFKISVFYFPRFQVFVGPYSKARKGKRGNSFPKSLLLGSSIIQKNRRVLCLLIPFYLVLSENYNFRDFHSFRVFDLAPLNVIDPWFKNFDEGKINLCIFLDLKKAFDTVDHKILSSKLREYGAEGASHSWLTSYLTNSEQFCYFDGSTSSKSSIECAIPQRLCLGPLLFILCINDFENCL